MAGGWRVVSVISSSQLGFYSGLPTDRGVPLFSPRIVKQQEENLLQMSGCAQFNNYKSQKFPFKFLLSTTCNFLVRGRSMFRYTFWPKCPDFACVWLTVKGHDLFGVETQWDFHCSNHSQKTKDGIELHHNYYHYETKAQIPICFRTAQHLCVPPRSYQWYSSLIFHGWLNVAFCLCGKTLLWHRKVFTFLLFPTHNFLRRNYPMITCVRVRLVVIEIFISCFCNCDAIFWCRFR